MQSHPLGQYKLFRSATRATCHASEMINVYCKSTLPTCLRMKKPSLQSDLTQASLDDPAIAAILSKRTDKKAFADDDRSPDLNPCLDPVRRRPRQSRSRKGDPTNKQSIVQNIFCKPSALLATQTPNPYYSNTNTMQHQYYTNQYEAV